MDREKKIKAMLDEITDMTDRIINEQNDDSFVIRQAKKLYEQMEIFEQAGFTEKQAFTLLCTVVNCSFQIK